MNGVRHIKSNKLIETNNRNFSQLVDDYKNRVFNTCYGFVQNKADADDLAQEVFIEVYQSANKFKGESSIATWIYRISVNKSLDFIKKKKRQKRWAILTQVNTDDNSGIDNLVSSSDNPEISLEQKDKVRILNHAISSLPTNQKTAFTLLKYEDLSYKEISEIMKMSISSIESLLHRAKKNLRIKLEKYYYSEKD